jgi:hypothetical protein
MSDERPIIDNEDVPFKLNEYVHIRNGMFKNTRARFKRTETISKIENKIRTDTKYYILEAETDNRIILIRVKQEDVTPLKSILGKIFSRR